MILGTGIDIVEIDRIKSSLERYGGRFMNRLLSSQEKEISTSKTGSALAQFVAGRFSAKEAVFKALGTGLDDAKWVDVSIERDDKGKPVAVLHGVAEARAAAMGVKRIHISISHSMGNAIAHAILEGEVSE